MTKTRIHPTFILLLCLLLAATPLTEATAQDFSVASFRELTNDVSAFIDPVRDLNDEDCALLKVVAPSDFAFSTPLGIVKRLDKTGEIWLYIPRGSRKITFKHADWGVLRDYQFPERLESHKTYEVTLSYPAVPNQGSTYSPPVSITVRDTLVVTRVDTLMITPVKPKLPLELDYTVSFGIGGKAPYTFCSMTAVLMKRHGGYLRISFNGGKNEEAEAYCDRHGLIDGRERFYSGETRKKVYMVGAGAIHRVSSKVAVFEGLGYADNTLDWQLAPSEGGGFVRNSYFSGKGLTAEAGIHLRFNHFIIVASVMTLKGTEWFGTIGIGFRLNKNDFIRTLSVK